jgi:hypothetical protein
MPRRIVRSPAAVRNAPAARTAPAARRCVEELESRRLLFAVPIHIDINDAALPFLNTQTSLAVDAEQAIVDTVGAFDSANHFDNSRFAQAVANINEQLGEAVADADPASLDPILAAGNFGHALHTVEDFYAHSNWVNLGQSTLFDDGSGYWTPVTPYEVRDGVMVVQGPSPYGLGSVTRDGFTVYVNTGSQVYKGVVTGQFGSEPDDVPPEAVVTHAELNKDDPSRPLHAEARSLATQQVRHEFYRLVELVRTRYGTAEPLLAAWVGSDPVARQQVQQLLGEESVVLGSVDAAGTLTLNVGPRAGQRGPYVDATDGNEAVTVTHVSGSPGSGAGETVDVSWGGFMQRFTASAVAVDAGNGNDALTLVGLQSPVTFAGGAGTDSLTVNAAAAATGTTLVVEPTRVTVGGATTDYVGVETVTVRGTAGPDAANVRGTAGGTAVTVSGAGGDDAFTVDSNGSAAGGTVDLVRGTLTLDGGAGRNTLTLEDGGDTTADVVTIGPAAVGAAAGDTFFGAGGRLAYTNLAAVTVNLPSATRGDTVRLTPSATTAFTINGNAPASPSTAGGDTLTINTAGTHGLKKKVTGKDAGVWAFNDRLAITYSGIEKVKST